MVKITNYRLRRVTYSARSAFQIIEQIFQVHFIKTSNPLFNRTSYWSLVDLSLSEFKCLSSAGNHFPNMQLFSYVRVKILRKIPASQFQILLWTSECRLNVDFLLPRQHTFASAWTNNRDLL